jgi:hypothetical protein
MEDDDAVCGVYGIPCLCIVPDQLCQQVCFFLVVLRPSLARFSRLLLGFLLSFP